MACDIRAGFLLRHRWLCSYGELQNAPSLLPQPQIDVPALFVYCANSFTASHSLQYTFQQPEHLKLCPAFSMKPITSPSG